MYIYFYIVNVENQETYFCPSHEDGARSMVIEPIYRKVLLFFLIEEHVLVFFTNNDGLNDGLEEINKKSGVGWELQELFYKCLQLSFHY